MQDRELLRVWRVTPHLSVAVEESLNILLVSESGTGPRWTLSNVSALKSALDHAREYVTIHEAVMADWRDDPPQGQAILDRLFPRA